MSGAKSLSVLNAFTTADLAAIHRSLCRFISDLECLTSAQYSARSTHWKAFPDSSSTDDPTQTLGDHPTF